MTRPWGVVSSVWGAREFGAGGVCSGSVVGECRRVRSAVTGWFVGRFRAWSQQVNASLLVR